MPTLKFDNYGKSGIRLTYVKRASERHELRELMVDILFEGEFSESYLSGNNRLVLPTDTMKNTVYVLARTAQWKSAEGFAETLAKHFLSTVSHLDQVQIKISETPWDHIGGHATAFVQSDVWRRTAHLTATRSTQRYTSGVRNLQILKTADSSFAGFICDQYTTLAETEDRLFGTVLDADWTYAQNEIDFENAHDSIRQTLLETFALHKSLSVQQTLFTMANNVIERFAFVQEVHLVMPNKHCLLVDLTRFGLDNPNQVFIPTDEPSGYIEARVER